MVAWLKPWTKVGRFFIIWKGIICIGSTKQSEFNATFTLVWRSYSDWFILWSYNELSIGQLHWRHICASLWLPILSLIGRLVYLLVLLNWPREIDVLTFGGNVHRTSSGQPWSPMVTKTAQLSSNLQNFSFDSYTLYSSTYFYGADLTIRSGPLCLPSGSQRNRVCIKWKWFWTVHFKLFT